MSMSNSSIMYLCKVLLQRHGGSTANQRFGALGIDTQRMVEHG